jgi:hypothetical protein
MNTRYSHRFYDMFTGRLMFVMVLSYPSEREYLLDNRVRVECVQL